MKLTKLEMFKLVYERKRVLSPDFNLRFRNTFVFKQNLCVSNQTSENITSNKVRVTA